MEMTNIRDYLRSLSWYILQWAAIPEDSDQFDGIDESVRMLIETQRKQADYVQVDLIKAIIRVVHDLEDPHDLTDYSFMVYQLYQICRFLIMFEDLNTDRLRVASDIGRLYETPARDESTKVYSQLTKNHNNIFKLHPIAASHEAHRLTEAGQWGHDIFALWPPVGYQWMSFWHPNL